MGRTFRFPLLQRVRRPRAVICFLKAMTNRFWFHQSVFFQSVQTVFFLTVFFQTVLFKVSSQLFKFVTSSECFCGAQQSNEDCNYLLVLEVDRYQQGQVPGDAEEAQNWIWKRKAERKEKKSMFLIFICGLWLDDKSTFLTTTSSVDPPHNLQCTKK